MDSKRFSILAGIALVAIAVAVWLVLKRAPESEGSLAGGKVLPALADKVNDVATLRFVQAGDKPLLTLDRGESGWTVAERDGYPADVAKVREYLLKLADARVVETKTANPERYATLGVEDVDAENATGLRVEVAGSGVDDKLIVGNFASQAGDGTYVRRPGEAESLLASGNLTPDRNLGQWLQRQIADIPSSRIREIVLVKGDGRPLRVYKENSGDANFKVADVPRGRELQSDVVANGLGSMLAGLTIDDVARAGDDGHGEAVLHRATYRTFDGVTVELEGWEADGKAYVQLTASLDEELAQQKIAADIAQEQAAAEADAAAKAAAEAAAADKPEGGDATAAGESATAPAETPAAPAAAAPIDVEARTTERLAALKTEVEQLNARFAGWRFEIPSYKFANVNKTMDDMLKSAAD